MFLSEALVWAVSIATGIISSLGYFGIFFLMALESMIAPVPSEMVMPFAGFLSATGRFDLWLVTIVATFGSLVGSLISYYAGRAYGASMIQSIGKVVFLNESHLDRTREWFEKHGEKTIFIGRFIPVVRHLISIPAGIGKMNLGKFLVYTVAGAGIWNFLLAYCGVVLGQNWETAYHLLDLFSIGVAVILAAGVIGWFWLHRRKKK